MSGHAYVDSSCIVAIALGEPIAGKLATRIRAFTSLLAHPLLDAEVRSACLREGAAVPSNDLAAIAWVEATRPLSAEVERVLAAGYLRGADCWHVATALLVSPDTRQLTFLTLDERQRGVAKKLGFKV